MPKIKVHNLLYVNCKMLHYNILEIGTLFYGVMLKFRQN